MIVQIERGENLHAFQDLDDYTVFAWDDDLYMKLQREGVYAAVRLADGQVDGMPGLRMVRPVTQLIARFD